MTTSEFTKFISGAHQRDREALEEIAQAARALVPILKDKALLETANALEEKLFLLDRIRKERLQTIEANLETAVEAMFLNMTKKL